MWTVAVEMVPAASLMGAGVEVLMAMVRRLLMGAAGDGEANTTSSEGAGLLSSIGQRGVGMESGIHNLFVMAKMVKSGARLDSTLYLMRGSEAANWAGLHVFTCTHEQPAPSNGGHQKKCPK